MKKSGLLAATVAAASASAISASSSSNSNSQRSQAENARDQENSSALKDKFAPRFDGLRFIETLVTAHR
ncbi:hypothetical protein HS088_TW06G00119 [Tripterygium wilfordii]|uniref:Uncharacterized protein n=1 Tax=Tripterygium wilfordii TaxID=458696 RepID=A0A7J7DI89_TRIWF|nr:uncharacterized protein LOC120000056 [Tripterygium wilfordii]KAF5745954.1 hypothetical protein HS088_TW06G00119 [Tripterygium wilfordii]